MVVERVSAARSSRFLRAAARAVETLVLSSWYQRRGLLLPDHEAAVPASVAAALRASDARATSVVAVLDGASGFALHADGSLGSPALGSRGAVEEVAAALSEGASQAVGTIDAVNGLATILDLDRSPCTVDAVDISHWKGAFTVGAVAAYDRGLPRLDAYACFALDDHTVGDDPAAIAETLRRRHAHGGSSSSSPDLILVDGGRGQLSAALAAVADLRGGLGGNDFRIAALAKRDEELYLPGQSAPLRLPRTSRTLTLLRRLRDEAHAAALLSHRSLRHDREFTSVLDGFDDPTDLVDFRALRRRFGSAGALRRATLGDLRAAVASDAAASALKSHLDHKNNNNNNNNNNGVRLSSSSLSSSSSFALGDALAGHESAVSAAAASSRRGSAAMRDSAEESRSYRWWAPRRDQRLEELKKNSRVRGALDDLLRAFGAADHTAVEAAVDFWRESTLVLPPSASFNCFPAAKIRKETIADPTSLDALATFAQAASVSKEAEEEEEEEANDSSYDDDDDDDGGAVSEGGRTHFSNARFVARQGRFVVEAPYAPAGDQPAAIKCLAEAVDQGAPLAVLRGATGTGKTFVVAKVLEATNRPALVIAPNKVLAAQLCFELRSFFPKNSVTFFISHFDYYRPESYGVVSQQYTEKASMTNDRIDSLRHEATRSLFERRDTIVVATVSCIYGLGMPEEYLDSAVLFALGQRWTTLDDLEARLEAIRYAPARGTRKNKPSTVVTKVDRGEFRRIRRLGDDHDRLLVGLVHEKDRSLELRFDRGPAAFASSSSDEDDGDGGVVVISGIRLVDHDDEDDDDGVVEVSLEETVVYPASHYTLDSASLGRVVEDIGAELEGRVAELRGEGRFEEAARLASRVRADLDQLMEEGFCRGLENYSRHLSGRAAGEPPATLLDYLPEDALVVVDESHLTVPQLGAMHAGDRSRKRKLVDHGFRLPSALDNRPLTGAEFWARTPQALFVSATPGAEVADRLLLTGDGGAEQVVVADLVVRPTGITDPEVHVINASAQGGYEDHLLAEVEKRIARGERTLVTCLTKRSAEDLADFFQAHSVRAVWLHSDVKAAARLRALDGLRKGLYDALVGCNLLREGLDLPEVALVAILGAEKQGFLRSATSLIQTIGRAARHVDGTVLLYTKRGHVSDSMQAAIDETNRRRKIQMDHNEATGTKPTALAPTATNHNAAAAAAAAAHSSSPVSDVEDLRSTSSSKKKKKRRDPLLDFLRGDDGAADVSTRREPGEGLESGALALYEELRAWRNGAARAAKRRPFMVLTEAVMQALAASRPASRAELLAVKGIGPVKADVYGDAVLDVIRAHAAATAADGAVVETVDKPLAASSEEFSTANQLPAQDAVLSKGIRAWAAREGAQVPEAVARAVAAARPETLDDLLAIRGIGPKKAALYGDALIALVQGRFGVPEIGSPRRPAQRRHHGPDPGGGVGAAPEIKLAMRSETSD